MKIFAKIGTTAQCVVTVPNYKTLEVGKKIKYKEKRYTKYETAIIREIKDMDDYDLYYLEKF